MEGLLAIESAGEVLAVSATRVVLPLSVAREAVLPHSVAREQVLPLLSVARDDGDGLPTSLFGDDLLVGEEGKLMFLMSVFNWQATPSTDRWSFLCETKE